MNRGSKFLILNLYMEGIIILIAIGVLSYYFALWFLGGGK